MFSETCKNQGSVLRMMGNVTGQLGIIWASRQSVPERDWDPLNLVGLLCVYSYKSASRRKASSCASRCVTSHHRASGWNTICRFPVLWVRSLGGLSRSSAWGRLGRPGPSLGTLGRALRFMQGVGGVRGPISLLAGGPGLARPLPLALHLHSQRCTLNP